MERLLEVLEKSLNLLKLACMNPAIKSIADAYQQMGFSLKDFFDNSMHSAI